MGFPVMAVAVGVTSLISALTAISNYNATESAIDYEKDFYGGAYLENKRFWDDYRRAHGWNSKRQIKYPYRTGYNYNLSALQNAGVREVSAKNSVYRSLASGIVPFGFYRGGGYSSRNNYPSVMYG